MVSQSGFAVKICLVRLRGRLPAQRLIQGLTLPSILIPLRLTGCVSGLMSTLMLLAVLRLKKPMLIRYVPDLKQHLPTLASPLQRSCHIYSSSSCCALITTASHLLFYKFSLSPLHRNIEIAVVSMPGH